MLVTYSDFNSGWADENLPQESKVFISLPMSGIDDLKVTQKQIRIFNAFKTQLNRDDLIMIDSRIQESEPKDAIHISSWYLGRSIKLMACSNIVIFSEDYWKARGCLAEHYICKEYKMPFCFESEIFLNLAKEGARE